MLGFALRDWAGGAEGRGAARTRGGTLAGGSSMQVRSCPRCASGKVVVKSSKDGKGNFFSCSAGAQACGFVVYLPGGTTVSRSEAVDAAYDLLAPSAKV